MKTLTAFRYKVQFVLNNKLMELFISAKALYNLQTMFVSFWNCTLNVSSYECARTYYVSFGIFSKSLSPPYSSFILQKFKDAHNEHCENYYIVKNNNVWLEIAKSC